MVEIKYVFTAKCLYRILDNSQLISNVINKSTFSHYFRFVGVAFTLAINSMTCERSLNL